MKKKTILATTMCGLALSLIGVGGVAAAESPSPRTTASASDSPTERTAARRSGKAWKSGLFAHSTGKARGFEKMRGSRVDFLSVHPARDSFATMMDTWWLSDTAAIRKAGASLEVTVPLWPANSSVHTKSSADWRRFGQLLVRKGERNAIIDIGKEFNLNNGWHIDADNQAAWRQRFREAVTALRSVDNERFRIAWTPNEGGSQTGVAPTAAWPGAKYVDIVAPDYYDQWEAITTWKQARARFNRTYGIEWWFKWAIARDVKVGVSEWGVSSGSQWAGHTGGDNPFYIRAMHDLFKRYQSKMAYESYFEEPESYVASSLVSQNPRARGQYRELW